MIFLLKHRKKLQLRYAIIKSALRQTFEKALQFVEKAPVSWYNVQKVSLKETSVFPQREEEFIVP